MGISALGQELQPAREKVKGPNRPESTNPVIALPCLIACVLCFGKASPQHIEGLGRREPSPSLSPQDPGLKEWVSPFLARIAMRSPT